MYIKANSPAVFAEKYLIQSIWNNQYPQGSILPAERELSEQIGVTRTTLREVLQRLARDGWITIQHGKPTQVNNFMQTAGLNILDTLLTLEGQDVSAVLKDLLSARNDISTSFIRTAINENLEESQQHIGRIIENCENLLKVTDIEEFLPLLTEDELLQVRRELRTIPEELKQDPAFYQSFCLSKAFAYCDYRLFQGLATASGNSVYLLTMNGMRKIYCRVASYYFLSSQGRNAALDFYRGLLELCNEGNGNKVEELLYTYSLETKKVWDKHRDKVANFLAQEG